MKKKDLIQKWLDHEQLTSTESEAFKNLDAYDSYVKISETAKKFISPQYNVEQNLQTLQDRLSERQKITNYRINFTYLARIAAVLVLAIGSYFMFFNQDISTVDTLASEKTLINLPDQTEVTLNALSSITYQEEDWDDNRKIKLEGEAYFKVAKGKKFDVVTSSGIISVLGTQFNVKQREGFFEVVCYEGLVSVTYLENATQLSAGNVFRVLDKKIVKTQTSLTKPNWTENRSTFSSTPYKYVLREFERQYNIIIISKNLDQDKLFTGNFVHSDIQTALQSITIPMLLKYEMNDNNITLYKQ
ncbi:FecR family protein [Aquimarina gracilis]|uniref:FecR family protein n=1 Tax=Aquimarina gracilis TaxID=874422 RepID=A0ABU5ZSR5_9FLAO|nr:FecR family protein [Aquimarina gracilis]MEB3344841.1 FecR family protein [Aquimarina gracilis]